MSGLRLLAGVLVSLFAAGVALAASSDVHEGPATTMRLITAEQGVAPGARSVSAGLHITLEEGWKAYWRSPGEVGLPPEIDWTGSQNLEAVEVLWPAPTRFRAFGIENYGYAKEVTLPLNITLTDPGAPLEMRASVFLLVCADVCVPEEAELSLSLPAGTGLDGPSAGLIAKAAAQVPVDIAQAEAELSSVAFSFDGGALILEAERPQGWQNPAVFPELEGGFTFGIPDIRVGDGGTRLWASLPVRPDPVDPGADHLSDALRLTLTDGAWAVQADKPALSEDPAPPPFAASGAQTGVAELAWIALIAVLGGLILNVMPCVLPVLSIKLASAIKAVDQSPARVRGGFAMSALGVMVFMWFLALGTLGARSLGMTIGWGIQFQNPFFLGVLLIIVTVFAANMLGLFEISLPSGLMTRLSGAGGGTGYGADFATGAFAAILATPCSAPFLGTAIAFAMAGRPIDIVVIFTALGLGLALPYLLVALRPGLVRALPKPGPWMAVLKVALGALLALTAAWLLWVMIGVAGPQASAAVAVALAALVLVFSPLGRRLGGARMTLSLVLGVLALAMPAIIRPQPGLAEVETQAHWVAFERARIAPLVASGQVVFVDVTADWCLTCKANKTLVLDRAPVSDTLEDTGVVAMRADWTRPDEGIAAYLQEHGRFGIPFNIVYGPNAPEGIALPELLTADLVMEALSDAGLARQVVQR